MKVIEISGKAQNGKDTVANMIQERLVLDGYKVLVTHFGDLLKYICRTFFEWDGNKNKEGRHLLQYVGTDIIRERVPNYWVDFVTSILSFFKSEWDYVIIPDARFPNEITKLVDCGFEVTHVRVVRSNFESPLAQEQQKHISETALDDTIPDSYIYNDSTLVELNSSVIGWVKENLYDNE